MILNPATAPNSRLLLPCMSQMCTNRFCGVCFFFPLKKQKPLIFPFTILGTWGRLLTPAERSAFSFPVSFFSSPEHRDSLPVRFLPPFTHPRLFLPGFFSLLSLRFCEEAAFRIFDMKVVRNEADQNETKQNKKNN